MMTTAWNVSWPVLRDVQLRFRLPVRARPARRPAHQRRLSVRHGIPDRTRLLWRRVVERPRLHHSWSDPGRDGQRQLVGRAHHRRPLRLSAEYGSHRLPLTLSLSRRCSRCRSGALFRVLKAAGWPAAFGAAMIFDRQISSCSLMCGELVAIGRRRAGLLAPRQTSRVPRSPAVGAAVDLGHDVLGFVGHFFSFGLAQLAFGLAIIKVAEHFRIGLADCRSYPRSCSGGWCRYLGAGLASDVGSAWPGNIGMRYCFIWRLAMSVVLLRRNRSRRHRESCRRLVADRWHAVGQRHAQTIEGRWKLLAAEDLRADGTVARYPWGRNPIGSIVVDRGWCYVQIMSSDVPAFTAAAPAIGEQMSAMLLSSYIAYSGRVHRRRQGRQRHAQGRRRVAAELRRHRTETVLPHREEHRMFFGPAPNSMRAKAAT